MGINTRAFNKIQGIAIAAAAGFTAWAVLVGAAMWAVSA